MKKLTIRLLSLFALNTVTLTVTGIIPGLYQNETALQIRASRQGVTLPDGFAVYQRLGAEGIRIRSITPDRNSLVIRFESLEQSNAAEKVLRQLLPEDFDIAQFEQSATGEWLSCVHPRKQTIG